MRRSLLWGILAAAVAFVAWRLVLAPPAVAPPPVLSTLPEFALVERSGRSVGRADFAGSIWIVDFVYTRCPSTCPMLTERLKKVRQALGPSAPVRFASISVDPEFDTPAVLDAYAGKHGIVGEDWWFLTGERAAVGDLVRRGFLAPLEAAPAGSASDPILHSTRFVLLDPQARVRGAYPALEPDGIARLTRDLAALEQEAAR
ncbi:MAG: SCO family protein [Thermoanaerobaculia bacterium]